MSKNQFNESISAMLNGLNSVLTEKMVIGEPKVINNTVIIPMFDVQVGLGVGAYSNAKESDNTAGGLGAKMSPNSILLIENGRSKLINIKNQETVTKILDAIPEIVDRITGKPVSKDPEVNDAVNKMITE